METKEVLHVSKEFLKQNSKHVKTKKSVKKGGPYTISEKQKRRDEVYRLHFEYGYSARKIADLMKVNRNTINGDIDYWYYKTLKGSNLLDPEFHIITKIESMQTQITRLRELLDRSKSVSERISIERLMYDINSKIMYTWEKLANSTVRYHKRATDLYNQTMKKHNQSERRITYLDAISVSKKSRDKIVSIIKEDRKSTLY